MPWGGGWQSTEKPKQFLGVMEGSLFHKVPSYAQISGGEISQLRDQSASAETNQVRDQSAFISTSIFLRKSRMK